MRTAAHQLAHHERRPAFAEDLGRARDRAELSVIEHVCTLLPRLLPAKCRFWTMPGAPALRILQPQNREISLTRRVER